MMPYHISLEANVGKVEDLMNFCITECKRTLSLFYRVLLVLLQDLRQKEVKPSDRTLGKEICATNKAMITTSLAI